MTITARRAGASHGRGRPLLMFMTRVLYGSSSPVVFGRIMLPAGRRHQPCQVTGVADALTAQAAPMRAARNGRPRRKARVPLR